MTENDCANGDKAGIAFVQTQKSQNLFSFNLDMPVMKCQWEPVLTHHDCLMLLSDWLAARHFDGDICTTEQTPLAAQE